MKRMRVFLMFGLLSMSSWSCFLFSGQAVSSIPVCTSTLPSSYQLQPGDVVFSVSHNINKNEYISMYVPTPAATPSLQGQNMQNGGSVYTLVASSKVPSKTPAALTLINQKLAQGNTVTIDYKVIAGKGANVANFYLHVSAKAGSSSKAFYKAEPFLLSSVIPLKNGGQQSYPFPAKESTTTDFNVTPPTAFDVEPATPFSIPFNLAVNSSSNMVLSGSLCFNGIFDSVKGWSYSASFTFIPATGSTKPNKPSSNSGHHSKNKKKISQVKTLVQALLKNDQAQTVVNAKKIAGVLESRSYTAADWGKFICKGLQRANVQSNLGKLIAQEMGVSATAYPCAVLK